MRFQTRGAANWLRNTLKELVHGWTSTALSMSGSSLFQGVRQEPVVSGYNVPYTLDGGPMKLSLSCWVRMVAGAREKNRDTREGCGTASVPPPQVEPKRGESYLVLRLVCAPVSWRVSPGVLAVWVALASGLLFRFRVCVSGPVVCSFPCCVVWFRPPGLFQKEATTQGAGPKTKVFSDRPTTCRVGSPWWPGMRGEDPRTDLLAGTPFYVRHYCGNGGG